MQQTFYDHQTPIPIGGRLVLICNRRSCLRFTDDIDLMGGIRVNFKTSPTDSQTEQQKIKMARS